LLSYQISEVRDKRVENDGSVYYKVVFDENPYMTSWEEAENIDNKELIMQFEKSIAK